MDKNVKKRGRKPKGGKIIEQDTINECQTPVCVQNIILHLKCRSKDLSPEIAQQAIVVPYCTETTFADVPVVSSGDTIQSKLQELSAKMHYNDVAKRSDCFWCTCAFDTAPIYIPQSRSQTGQFKVYGCFCCPECAVAYLFHESKLDHTVRFERYHLLNYMYASVLNYTKNIEPAPSPYFLLNKYYGSLTIDEFRTMVRTTPIMVVDKPICLSFPEIGETTVQPIKGDAAVGYRLCRKKK